MEKQKYLKKCPICGYNPPKWSLSNQRRTLQHIRHHFTVKAKNELWTKEFDKQVETPHLDFWRKSVKIGSIELKYKLNFLIIDKK